MFSTAAKKWISLVIRGAFACIKHKLGIFYFACRKAILWNDIKIKMYLVYILSIWMKNEWYLIAQQCQNCCLVVACLKTENIAFTLSTTIAVSVFKQENAPKKTKSHSTEKWKNQDPKRTRRKNRREIDVKNRVLSVCIMHLSSRCWTLRAPSLRF